MARKNSREEVHVPCGTLQSLYSVQVDFDLKIYIASFLTNIILIFSHLISYGFVDRGCFYRK